MLNKTDIKTQVEFGRFQGRKAGEQNVTIVYRQNTRHVIGGSLARWRGRQV